MAMFVGLLISILSVALAIPRSQKFILEKLPFLKAPAEQFGNLFRRIKEIKPKQANTLNKMSKVLKWSHNKEEIDCNKSEFNKFLLMLSKLSPTSRKFLCVLVERSSEARFDERQVLACDIENYLSLTPTEIKRQVSILEKYGLAYLEEGWEGDTYISIKASGIDFDIYEDIMKFCKTEKISLKRLLVNLEFNLLD